MSITTLRLGVLCLPSRRLNPGERRMNLPPETLQRLIDFAHAAMEKRPGVEDDYPVSHSRRSDGQATLATIYAKDLRAIQKLGRPSWGLRTVTVFMSDGDTITTSINGTDEEIMRHYLGKRFEAGSDTKHHVALCIHFHDTEAIYGLRIKCIEHAGVSGCIASVRKERVDVDENTSFDEIILTTRSDSEYALSDVWVYDLDGEWIKGIGYKHTTA